MKQDKADKIIKKAELKAQKAAKQVEAASKKAEIAKQKQAAQAQKKAAKAADSATKKAAKKTKKAEQVAKKAQLAAKKAEEKKAKAIAKAADRAAGPKKGEGEGEEGAPAGKGKKKGKKKLLMIAIPVLAVAVGVGAFFFLRGGKEEEEAPPEPIAAPAEYVLNESHISALPVWGDVVVYQEEVPLAAEPEEGADAAAEGEEAAEEGGDAAAEEVSTRTLYRYEALQEPSVLVSAYTALMTTADAGFSTVDETLLRIDPPEEFGPSGTIQLARNVPAAEDGTGGGVHSLLLSWSGTSCSVMLDTPEGRVRDPKPETPASTAAPRRGLSDIQALHPSKLGLAGESMDAYKLMPQEGSVRIAGEPSPAMQINVYDENGQYAGRIFLSGSGRLYKLDENVNAVVELQWE